MRTPDAVRATPAPTGCDPRTAVRLGGANGGLITIAPDVAATVANGSSVDPRLAFLARAGARLSLVEAAEISLEDAINGLIEPFEALVGPLCRCIDEVCERWEREYPPVRRRGWK